MQSDLVWSLLTFPW